VEERIELNEEEIAARGDSVSIGVGAMLSDMVRVGVRPYDNTTGASPASSSRRRR